MNKYANYLHQFCCGCLLILLFTEIVSGQSNERKIAQHTQAATKAQREGDFATAIQEYTILSRLMPQVAEVHSNLGVAYYFHKKRPEALVAFRRALKLNPNLTSALIFAGIVNFELSQTSEAIKLLERAVELNPSDSLAQTWLGFSYAAQSRFQEAVTHFQIASGLSPNDVDALYGLGQAYIGLGQQVIELFFEKAPSQDEDKSYKAAKEFHDNAKRALERIVAINPDSYRAHQVLAESLIAEGKLDDALTEYHAILRLKPDLAGIHIEIGNLLMSNGKAVDALEEYKAELTLRPNNARLHYRIGRALIVLGRIDEAESLFNHALALAGPPPSTHRELGRIYIGRGQADKAIKSLSIYLSSSRSAANDPAVHYLLIRAYRALGNNVAAEHHLAKFKSLSDNEKQRTSIQEALSLFNRQKNNEQ